MLINTMSVFPSKPDELPFFQDINCEQQEIMQHYNQLISQGNYSEANEYISQQNINGYFADFFNALENRIYNTQAYLLTLENNNNTVYSEEEPTENLSEGMIWID